MTDDEIKKFKEAVLAVLIEKELQDKIAYDKEQERNRHEESLQGKAFVTGMAISAMVIGFIGLICYSSGLLHFGL